MEEGFPAAEEPEPYELSPQERRDVEAGSQSVTVRNSGDRNLAQGGKCEIPSKLG